MDIYKLYSQFNLYENCSSALQRLTNNFTKFDKLMSYHTSTAEIYNLTPKTETVSVLNDAISKLAKTIESLSSKLKNNGQMKGSTGAFAEISNGLQNIVNTFKKLCGSAADKIVEKMAPVINGFKNMGEKIGNLGTIISKVDTEKLFRAYFKIVELAGTSETTATRALIDNPAFNDNYAEKIGAIKSMSMSLGVDHNIAIEAMTQIHTLNIKGAKTFEEQLSLLARSVMLAKAQNIDTADAISINAQMLKAYNMSAADTVSANNAMLFLKSNVPASFDSAKDAVSRMAPAAVNANVPIGQVAAALAALTAANDGTLDTAASQLETLLKELGSAGSPLQNVLKDVANKAGYTDTEYDALLSKGNLQSIIDLISDAGKPAQELLGAEIGGIINSLMANPDKFQQANALNTSGTDIVQSQFKTISGTFDESVKRLNESLHNLYVTIGNLFLPEITFMIQFVTMLAGVMNDISQSTIGSFFAEILLVTVLMMAALPLLLISLKMLAGVMVLLSLPMLKIIGIIFLVATAFVILTKVIKFLASFFSGNKENVSNAVALNPNIKLPQSVNASPYVHERREESAVNYDYVVKHIKMPENKYTSNTNAGKKGGIVININEISLPDVHNGESFIESLRGLALSLGVQNA